MPSTTQLLSLEPLTAAAFGQFGEVIAISATDKNVNINNINNNTCQRYNGLAHIEVEQGRAGISIFRAEHRPNVFCLECLERHPLGSQAFYPLDDVGFVVVVAPDKNGKPDWENIRAFAADSGVNFYKNTWHHPLIAVGRQSHFLVVDRLSEQDGDNLEEVAVPEHHTIQINLPA